MSLLLLRHAHAGDRGRWQGDDRARPLTDRGKRQAEALPARLGDRPIARVLTSPWIRCVQTVAPLATAYHLDVEEEDALGEGMPLDVVHRLFGRLRGSPSVLCSHGDVIAAVLTDLHHAGVVAEEELRWAKGSTWVLDADGDGAIVRARYLPPPA